VLLCWGLVLVLLGSGAGVPALLLATHEDSLRLVRCTASARATTPWLLRSCCWDMITTSASSSCSGHDATRRG
jgi:hypothetical protein